MTSYGEIIFAHKLPLDYVEFHKISFSDFPQGVPNYNLGIRKNLR
jgi:hypothetical protein